MTSLEGKRFEVTSDDLTFALDLDEQDGFKRGEEFEVVADPADFEMIDEECVKVVMASNYDVMDSEDVYPAQPVVIKSELEARTKEVA